MKVVVAPDSFKGTYAAGEVAAAIADGLRSAGAEAVELPVADGGEGSLDVLRDPLALAPVETACINAWGTPIRAELGLSASGTAVVEVARTCGLYVGHDGRRDPRTASTYGVGQQISAAVDLGASHVVVAAGGSATTDGGSGAVQAIDERGGLGDARLTVLSDVRTRFTQAAVVFGRQKGADEGDLEYLTRRLERQRRRLPRDPDAIDGTGAAGGLAGGLWARFGATIEPGAAFVLNAAQFDRHLQNADAVVVGEGCLDNQTLAGKIVSEILTRAMTVPVHAVVGSVGGDAAAVGAPFASLTVASTLDQLVSAGRLIGASGHLSAVTDHPGFG